MYLLAFYVPESHTETVKEAIFATGAGTIENYGCCCWQTSGTGQFMPLLGSHAFIGHVNQLERVTEFKVEIVCTDEQLPKAVEALKKVHPYETPAYQIIQFEV